MRSSIESKVKYNVNSSTYLREMREKEDRFLNKKIGTKPKHFDIITDKPSKFIINLNKFFDIDANKQINEINGKKIITENPYIKVGKSMSSCAGSSKDSLA